MLDSHHSEPFSSSSTHGINNAAAVKRYAPPFQRNRTLNRRKSGERFDRVNTFYGVDEEKNQTFVSKSVHIVDHKVAGGSNLLHDISHQGLIALDGCCSSEASQLLNDRWATAMKYHDDPSMDVSERPVMYPGSNAPAWGQFRLPHQQVPSAVSGGSSASQLDFLGELRRAMHNASANSEL